jgi:hypothetical protein
MKGNVFQCHGETTTKQQFLRTIGVLEEHINKTFDYPQDVASVCKSFEIKPPTMPANLEKSVYEGDMGKRMIWETAMKTYMKRTDKLESNTRAIYAIVWGQCSPMMQSKLESLDEYTERSTDCDCIWLLQEIQGITHRFEGNRHVFISMDDAWEAYYGFHQGNLSLHAYLKEFQSIVQVLEHYGAAIGADGPYIKAIKEKLKATLPSSISEPELHKRALAASKLQTAAMGFLKRADQRRYGALWSELENNYTRGLDQFPADVTGMYHLLLSYQPAPTRPPRNDRNDRNRNTPDEDTAMSFLQDGKLVAGTDGEKHSGIKCFHCNKPGHYASACPRDQSEPTEGVQMLQVAAPGNPPSWIRTSDTQESLQFLQLGSEEDTPYESAFTFAQTANGHTRIPSSWILLDSQSTVSVFKNPSLLTNIRASPRPLRVHTNGGTQLSNLMGHVKNFGDVWFNPHSLANILSMAEVRRVCRITMDSAIEPAMTVHRADGSLMKFQEYKTGLYYYDTLAAPEHPNSTSFDVNDYLFLHTVAGNQRAFTRREIQGANRARDLYKKIGRPSEQEFTDILTNNLIRNCPVTPDDAKRALKIYGPDVATLKGKTVKKQNSGIPNYQATQLPAPIIAQYNNVRLFIDIFWVNGSPYFHTISEWVKFRTVAAISNRSKRTLLLETQAIIHLYQTRGFTVTRVEGDREFSCLENDLLPTPINIADADDHVAEVERSIRTIKERTRALIQGLPFRRIPKAMMRAAIENANKSLNQFPAKNGVSDTLSPLTIMTGRPTPDYNDMKIEFGAYAQVFEANEPTNTVKARTTGAIALTPTGNAQGGYYFLSLATGRKLSRQQWDELPMPDGVIAAVERMAQDEEQPLVGHGAPFFEWTPGVPIQEDAPEPIIIPEHEPADFIEAENVAAPDQLFGGDPAEEEDETASQSDTEGPEEGLEPPHDTAAIGNDFPLPVIEHRSDTDHDHRSDTDHDPSPDDDPSSDYDDDTTEERSADTDVNDNVVTVEDGEDDPPDEPVPARNLRPNRTRDYSHRLAHVMDNPAGTQTYDLLHDAQFFQHAEDNDEDGPMTLREAVEEMQLTGANHDVLKCMTGIIMTQMSAQAGIKKHGQVAIDALFEEFAQLHDLGVFLPQDVDKLTKPQKKAALRAISVVKEKRCGRIKGRTVADGRPQRQLYTKDETSSPTVSTDALMLSLMIDAHERRDVATADVAGAYLHAEMVDFTLLKMEGASVDIMCDVCDDYKKYVRIENGKKVLYLKLLKALYGCVQSALLWYDLFSNTLEKAGFELNPYDTCVANKMIDGKQCTIAWYVDDNKISHADGNVVTHIIETIEARFGKMTVTRGKEHVFLGMDIKFHANGTVSVKMKEYIKEAIADFGDDITRTAATPAKKNLFDIDETADPLSRKDGEIFHSVVAKLLYVSKRSRLDIQLPIAFLCTRVSCSTTQDWMKLKRVLEYLRGTLDEFLTLGADDIGMMKTWVDASYAVHQDMKSHTGGVVSFGIGAVMSKSSKQKLNVKSSTEAELVGASDYLPYPIWAKKFLACQGYVLKENVFYQDNQSTIRFEKNGRKSCGPNSRHIDIRYFFIKDRIGLETIDVQHCPTEQMLADFFTKPLQGGLFRKFREVVLGHKHIDTLKPTTPSPSQERVGRHIIGNGPAGQKTDVRTQQPTRATYAAIAKQRPSRISSLRVRGA